MSRSVPFLSGLIECLVAGHVDVGGVERIVLRAAVVLVGVVLADRDHRALIQRGVAVLGDDDVDALGLQGGQHGGGQRGEGELLGGGGGVHEYEVMALTRGEASGERCVCQAPLWCK